MALQFQRGAILWVDRVPDRSGGDPKSRPVVILSELNDTVPTVVGVAITTRFDQDLEPISVKLAYKRSGGCKTGLKEPSIALCDWIVPVTANQVTGKSGYVSSVVLKQIIEIVESLG